MVYPNRKIFIVALLLSIMFLSPAFGEEEKKADATVKESTATAQPATVNSATPALTVESAGEPAAPGSDIHPTAETNTTTTGDINVYNYGIQAIFINSKVTVSGGTISGEMTKTAPPAGAAPGKAQPEGSHPKPSGESTGGTPGKPAEKPGKFDELIKDATKEAGLFTVYSDKEDKVYWEVLPAQLDTNFLLTGTLATGLGVGRIKPGAYLDGLVVQFTKIDNKIQLVQRNLRFTASGDPIIQSALDKNYSGSIIASFPVEATNPANAGYMLEMGKFFLTDIFNVHPDIASSLGGGFGFDRPNSYIKETKTFPDNVVTRTCFAFRASGPGGSIAVPSPGSAQLDILVDIRPLQDNSKFEKRQADPRVGHFIEAHMDFSDTQNRDRFVRYVNKWDIRKASPELPLSPPVKPLVIWIEKTVPEKYRDPIQRGILEWNKAFEKIGIKNAIQVKIQSATAEWDISDGRYNAVHWNESYNMLYSASTDFIADPRTGELLHGGFMIEGDEIRGLLSLKDVREPDLSDLGKEKFSHEAPQNSRFLSCDYQTAKTDQALFGLTLMAARQGIGNVSPAFLEDFIDQFLFSVSCHEFGHVLGLRHNFEGSTMLPLDELHDKTITKEKSISSSIMDYAPVNFAPEGVQQGYYFEPTIGPYDYLAIQYAYQAIKPATGETEETVLNHIAEKAETPEYIYATDEDLYGGAPYYGSGINPLCNQFDLSNDPLGFAKQQTQLILDTIPKLPKLVKEGDTYTFVRSAYNRLILYFLDSADLALKYIGGQYVHRVKKGGPQDRKPLEPVSAAKQREAVNFLVETIFSDHLFQTDPEILDMLASEKWLHWGVSWPGPASEFPLNTIVQNVYDNILSSIYDSGTIHRILNAEKQVPHGEVTFTVPELFRRLKLGIWKEVYDAVDQANRNGGNFQLGTYSNTNPLISTYRRILQREQLKLVIEITLEPPAGMPDDARTQAWRTLVDLEKHLTPLVDTLKQYPAIDDYSRDHLAESLEKIHRALDARVNVGVDLW